MKTENCNNLSWVAQEKSGQFRDELHTNFWHSGSQSDSQPLPNIYKAQLTQNNSPSDITLIGLHLTHYFSLRQNQP